MNQKNVFSSKGNIVVISLVGLAVIIATWLVLQNINNSTVDTGDNEVVGTQASKQCRSDKDCSGVNSYCAWGICKQAKDIASTEKTNGSMVQATSTNLFPANNAVLSSEDAMKEITFRWTPVVPKPQEPVVYRLKVWQLMQGQNSTEAMRSNQPIVTKDVDNITQASVSGIYTGPCRPPYLCEYVWNVEVSKNRESAGPAVIDVSASFTFSVK
jgi:hypothetical protein